MHHSFPGMAEGGTRGGRLHYSLRGGSTWAICTWCQARAVPPFFRRTLVASTGIRVSVKHWIHEDGEHETMAGCRRRVSKRAGSQAEVVDDCVTVDCPARHSSHRPCRCPRSPRIYAVYSSLLLIAPALGLVQDTYIQPVYRRGALQGRERQRRASARCLVGREFIAER